MLVASEPLQLQLGDTYMSVFPHDRLRLSCTSADRQGRHTQFLCVELSPQAWQRELAPARTFCFYEEIEYLIQHGLIRGGSLANAIVIRDDAILTTEPLRFPDEFVRHKMLDLVGDLALLGKPLAGHVVSIKPSHAANCELARQIQLQAQKPLRAVAAFAPPEPAKPQTSAAGAPVESPVVDGATLDIHQVMRILPHRYPFLMVDKVTRIAGNKITAQKNVTIDEPFFEGHFPNHPIMPGVLQLEAIAQAAGILMMKLAAGAGKLAYFMSAESVKWRKPVRPGVCLVIEVELTKARGKIGKAKGACLVDGDVVSEAEVTFMLVEA
jgi:UDP-3-O-[3-hydroxymyristoyl] N-acetylglucosamine deacetylase/3-hydroxyacyl-[acyl-carrier-protein] dehydratase